MAWFAERMTDLRSKRFHRKDAVLLAVLLVCLGLLYWAWSAGTFSFRREYPVSQGYQARSEGGSVYVLDSGHGTLTRSDQSGRVAYRVSPGLYVDGFTLGDDGCVYMNASAFSGMTVVGEQVLQCSASGELKVLARRDYGEDFLVRHALHGASERDGILRYCECGETGILVHALRLDTLEDSVREIPWENAFRKVSDACFCGDTLYVLDRNGSLYRFPPEGAGELLYSTETSGERDRVPYRLEVSPSGEVYFSDIRTGTVQRVLPGEGRSETVAETVSVTVGADAEGKLTLAAENCVFLPEGELTAFQNGVGPVVHLYLAWLLLGVTALLALLFLVRLLVLLFGIVRSHLQQMLLAVVAMGLVTLVLTGTVLISGFRDAYTDKINEELLVSSMTAAHSIRPEDVLSINRPADYDTEAYLRLLEVMENCFDRSVDFNRNAYCNILRYDGEGCAYAVAYLDGTIGTYYPLGDYETAETVQVYETKQPVISDAFADISGIYLGVKVPILDGEGNCVGVVSSGTQVVLLQALLRSMVFRVLGSILLFAVMVWFLFSELFAYVKNLEIFRVDTQPREQKLPGHTFRLVMVLVFALYNLQASFLPGYIVHQLAAESKYAELLASLPYMVNIFLFGITAILCSPFLRRIGPMKLLVLSLVASLAGNLMIFLFAGYFSILLGMGLIGVGVGLLSNMMYILLTDLNDDSDRVWGLSIYNAAAMAGINIGMVGGSILAVLLGQRAVFAVAAVLWFIMLFLAAGLVRKISGAVTLSQEPVEKKPDIRLRTLFQGRVIPYFMACIQNPYIVFGSFVMYYLPIFCDVQGYSETSTALMLLCYTELSILAGDYLVFWCRRRMGDASMYAAIGIDIAAMLLFALTRNLTGMIVALFLMGLSASFGKPVQQLYYMRLPQVEQYGKDRAMGVYNFTENIGESLGPVIMGYIMFRTPLFPAVAGFCGLVALLGGSHAIFTLVENKRK